MKRRYKEGDWIRIGLGGASDALGIITRACRSRLFGYFFPIPAQHAPAHAALKALGPGDAALCALFGGAALDEARWEIVATAVPFEREAWPFPQFAQRGAFGRTWSVRTYDPERMQAVRSRSGAESAASGLPAARFYDSGELETLLRGAFEGTPADRPLAVYDAGASFDPAGLQLLERGGRIQFSRPLSEERMRVLAAFLAAHPQVELRVRGFSRTPFDLRALAPLRALRALILDAQRIANPAALSELRALRSLRTGSPAALPLERLPELRSLEVRGASANLDAVLRCSALESLVLSGAPPFPGMPSLRVLRMAHGSLMPGALAAMPGLTHLDLRAMALPELPDLSGNACLEELSLRGVRLLRDLRPLQRAPALRALRLEDMPQLEVPDLAPLAGLALRAVSVDTGSRRKNREIYRMLGRHPFVPGGGPSRGRRERGG